MDQKEVEKIQLTNYGFRLNLIRFSRFLSIFGIVVSVLEIILSIALIGVEVFKLINPEKCPPHSDFCPLFNLIIRIIGISDGAITAVLFILFLVLFVLLKNKTGARDLPGIEKIAKIYCYVTGSLEIIVLIAFILLYILSSWESGFSFIAGLLWTGLGYIGYLGITRIIFFIIWLVYLVFACLKIHGIRTQKNGMIRTFIIFRYVIFVLIAILDLVSIQTSWRRFITWIFFSILDIGLINILHSIRVDRANKSTETIALRSASPAATSTSS